jgi:hypothetical protein
MAIDYAGFAQPKPISRKRLKARAKREKRDKTAEVREYVFTREMGLCRCCRFRRAESMHEIRFRSQGGKVSRKNSIAVCGNGVEGCHGRLQRHEIQCGIAHHGEGADGRLYFQPHTSEAGEWLRVERLNSVESGPTPQIRGEVEC